MPDIAPAVTRWLVEGLMLRGGERVIEIAGGFGVLSLAAAGTGRPASVICSDIDVAAVARAREGADSNPGSSARSIVFLAADMARLPFHDAAFDAAVCRWGFMFAAEPQVPFREAGRVLRPGGRLAFAVWDTRERNPWQSILDDTLHGFGIEDRAAKNRFGGMFGLADETQLRALLRDADFSELQVQRLPLVRRYRDFDEYWAAEVDVGRRRAGRLRAMSSADAEAFRHRLIEGLARYRGDGGYEIPGLVLAAAAVAEGTDAAGGA